MERGKTNITKNEINSSARRRRRSHIRSHRSGSSMIKYLMPMKYAPVIVITRVMMIFFPVCKHRTSVRDVQVRTTREATRWNAGMALREGFFCSFLLLSNNRSKIVLRYYSDTSFRESAAALHAHRANIG